MNYEQIVVEQRGSVALYALSSDRQMRGPGKCPWRWQMPLNATTPSGRSS